MDNIISELYKRQESNFPSFSDKSAIVIGCGGVGSWIAIDLALIGMGTIILIDKDKLEVSNLNRTLFKTSQIDEFKTKATEQLIRERRPDTIVITIEDYFKTENIRNLNVDYIFDATDNLSTRCMIKGYRESESFLTPYCKVGYDGYYATLSLNEFEAGRWGDEGTYQIVSSFFGTPQILSAIAVIEMLLCPDKKEASVNFKTNTLLNKIQEAYGVNKE